MSEYKLGTDPKRKAAELSMLRGLRARAAKDRDAFELAFALEGDQLLFNELRKGDRLLGILDRVIEKRESR